MKSAEPESRAPLPGPTGEQSTGGQAQPFPRADRMPAAVEMNVVYRRLNLPNVVVMSEQFTCGQINVMYEALGVLDRAVACDRWEPHRVRLNEILSHVIERD